MSIRFRRQLRYLKVLLKLVQFESVKISLSLYYARRAEHVFLRELKEDIIAQDNLTDQNLLYLEGIIRIE